MSPLPRRRRAPRANSSCRSGAASLGPTGWMCTRRTPIASIAGRFARSARASVPRSPSWRTSISSTGSRPMLVEERAERARRRLRARPRARRRGRCGSARVEPGAAANCELLLGRPPVASGETAEEPPQHADVHRTRLSGGALALQDELGDLDRVQRRALAEVVAREEEREAVLDRRVAADAADEHLVVPAPPCPASGSRRRAPTARRRAARAPAPAGGRPRVSIQIASAWPTITGTRTHVAWIGRSGSSRIFCVSARSFDSSSNSSPSKLPVHAQVVLVLRLVAQPLHRLRAGARDRLVRRDAHAHEPGCVVQRLQHAR